MSMLPERELAQMRDVVDSALAGTAIIQTATKTSDGQGGLSWTYAASGTVVARLSPESDGNESAAGGRLAEVAPWVLTVPAGTSVDEDDRIVYETVTYEVTEVLTRNPWEISRRVRLMEVD